MKPYCRVLYNKIRFTLRWLIIPGFRSNGIQMFSGALRLHLDRSCHVEFEDRIVSDGRMVINVGKNAHLHIGRRVYFNEDAMISCKGNISIGNGCKFGPNVKIFDNNHRFDANRGVLDIHSCGSIEIEENCWIAANVVILKGAHIGKNSVIGAGCVVDGFIPEKSIVTQGRSLLIERIRE